jgi:hypothetical protein
MKACGSLAMRSSKSMSPRSPFQFQHLSLSVFSFYPPVFLRRFARVVGGGLLGSFLATGQQAPCFSKRGLPLFLLTFPGLQIILECR